MKYLVVIPDGAADYPIEALGGKTPFEAAEKPTVDRLAADQWFLVLSVWKWKDGRKYLD